MQFNSYNFKIKTKTKQEDSYPKLMPNYAFLRILDFNNDPKFFKFTELKVEYTILNGVLFDYAKNERSENHNSEKNI